jgi:hypothetical protein
MQIFTTSGNRGSIAGFQVVGVREPSSWALAALSLGGFLVFGWRAPRAKTAPPALAAVNLVSSAPPATVTSETTAAELASPRSYCPK